MACDSIVFHSQQSDGGVDEESAAAKPWVTDMPEKNDNPLEQGEDYDSSVF